MTNEQNGIKLADATATGPVIEPWKRALDLALIVLAIPVLVPLMAGIALMIRFVSRGPILFRQERVGYRGRRFMCFKFRTMNAGSETTSHQNHISQLMSSNKPLEKMDSQGDPRIIRGGILLRASGLDELPQIINIIRGDMSMVGPRPCVPYEYEIYQGWQLERFSTVPGLTGLWQVSGKNKTTFDQMVKFDIEYSRKKSLWFDIKIIFKTIPTAFMLMLESRKRKKSAARAATP